MESKTARTESATLLESVADRLLRLILLPAGTLALLVFIGQVANHDRPMRCMPALILSAVTFFLRFVRVGTAIARARFLTLALAVVMAYFGWVIGTFRAPGEIGLAAILIAWACLFLPRRWALATLVLLLAYNIGLAILIHAGVLVEQLAIPLGIVVIALSGVYLVLYVTMAAPIRILFESVAASRNAERVAREALVELQNSRNFTIQAVDNSLHLFGWLTPDGILQFANSTALGMIQARREDVLGRLFWETPWFQHDAQEQRTLREAVVRAARGEVVRYETTHRTHGGDLREIELSLQPIRDGDGAISMVVTEGRDVTEEREAIRQRESLSERLHQSQKMEVVGQLTGGVAHDFNNSLTSISGLAQILRDGTPGESERTKFLDMILDATGRSTQLIRRLLAFSRKNERKLDSLVDLVAIAQDVANILRSTQDRRVTVGVESELDTAVVPGDESMLQNAFLNMGINAFHAMPDGGSLLFLLRGESISAEVGGRMTPSIPSGRYIEVAIRDSGCGMSPDVVDKIFEPFFTTKEPGKGTGLGMTMVRDSLKELCGSISVESAIGEGTTFRVHLPRAD